MRSGERGRYRSFSSRLEPRFLIAALIGFLLVVYAGIRLIPPHPRARFPEPKPVRLELNIAPVELVVEGPLNINTATAEELEELPGIGPELARRIIAYREEHGPFKSVEDLLNVKGIGPATLQKIRDLITVGEPET